MKPSTLRVLRSLQKGKRRTKQQIYADTGVDSVAQRIQELREMECEIETDPLIKRNRHGERVRIAGYRLVRMPRSVSSQLRRAA